MSTVLIEECKILLLDKGINPASTVEFDVNGDVHTFSFQEIIATYMQASDEAQLVFVAALKKAMEADNMGVQKFFEGMGQLLLMTHLSDEDTFKV